MTKKQKGEEPEKTPKNKERSKKGFKKTAGLQPQKAPTKEKKKREIILEETQLVSPAPIRTKKGSAEKPDEPSQPEKSKKKTTETESESNSER